MQFNRKGRRYQRLHRWCAKKDLRIPGIPESGHLSSSEDFDPWSESETLDSGSLCDLCGLGGEISGLIDETGGQKGGGLVGSRPYCFLGQGESDAMKALRLLSTAAYGIRCVLCLLAFYTPQSLGRSLGAKRKDIEDATYFGRDTIIEHHSKAVITQNLK